MSDEIDPSIAALLAETADSLPGMSRSKSPSTMDSFASDGDSFQAQLQRQMSGAAMPQKKSGGMIPDVDLSIKGFAPIEKFYEDTPNPVFDEPSYYKSCLTGEGEASQRLHQILLKYLNCQDKKDRTVYRQQIVSAYWEFLREMAPKMALSGTPMSKRYAMRFGVVLPSLFMPEVKEYFSRAIFKNVTNEPVLYMDEWIGEVAKGRLTPSTTDEVSVKSKGPEAEKQRLNALKSKNAGKIQSSENLLNVKEHEREAVEREVEERIHMLLQHNMVLGFEPHTMPYSDQQKRLFAEITQRFHALQKIDRELTNYLKEFQDARGIADTLDAKSSEIEVDTVNVGKEEILGEMTTIRQMAKMTCGRQGNQFPIYTREFFHCLEKGTGFRENVLRELAWIESIDPNCFCRIHKNISHRIVPLTLLVPTYGDIGFCWEPFDRMNRVTSRGRIVIPMYPRDLRISCLTAVADLRWQVAKEKASFDWMSEGLTGNYYQYLANNGMKGDIKQYFIEDYILWMTKEANGTQKLNKEVRAIFWRFIPFPQALKEDLKKRSLIYQELFQRDVNRSMSDGY